MIDVSVADRVATVTLASPANRNAITVELAEELATAVDRLAGDEGVGAIVVAAQGPVFCAGGDRATLARADRTVLTSIYRAFLAVRESPIPTVAAVAGPAVGAGLNLALACDVRVVGPSARFDTRFLTLGVHSGGGATWMLREAVGYQAASAMLIFGEVLDGERAAQLGLAWTCVPDSGVLAAARALAARAAGFDREVLVLNKDSLRRAGREPRLATMVEVELERQAWSFLPRDSRGNFAHGAIGEAGNRSISIR